MKTKENIIVVLHHPESTQVIKCLGVSVNHYSKTALPNLKNRYEQSTQRLKKELIKRGYFTLRVS